MLSFVVYKIMFVPENFLWKIKILNLKNNANFIQFNA